MNCSHPSSSLQDFREPSEGDTVSPGGEVGLLADCGDCGETTLVRMNIIEKMNWNHA